MPIRASMARQQRSVDVDNSLRGDRQNLRRNDLSVRDDDHQIRIQLAQSRDHCRVANLLRLQNRQAQLQRGRLDRRRGDVHAVARAVRLRKHQHDFMAGAVKRSQRGHGERGRAGENDPEEGD